MDPISHLQEIGFTRYEAMIYVALVSHPGLTGYEVSKYSGVPRAKVYEVLESMTQRGHVLVAHEDDRQLYRALPHDLLLDRYRTRLEQVVGGLREQLGVIEKLPHDSPISTIRGHESVMQRAHEMIAEAGRSVLVSGFPQELLDLRTGLQSKENSGLSIYALIYGTDDLGLTNLYYHNVSPHQYRQTDRYGRWLALIRDMDEALLCQVRSDGTTALWTSNMGVVMALAMWIQHDITVCAMLTEFDPDLVAMIMSKMHANTALTELLQLVLDDRREDDQSERV